SAACPSAMSCFACSNSASAAALSAVDCAAAGRGAASPTLRIPKTRAAFRPLQRRTSMPRLYFRSSYTSAAPRPGFAGPRGAGFADVMDAGLLAAGPFTLPGRSELTGAADAEGSATADPAATVVVESTPGVTDGDGATSGGAAALLGGLFC